MTRRTAGTALFVLAFVVLGLPDAGHGVAWPDMRADLERGLADLGIFLGVQTLGYLAGAATAGRTASRWGMEGLVLRATGVSAVGLGLIAVAPGWSTVLAGGLLAGAGAGGMDAGFNAAVAVRNDTRLMGLLHAGYGVGAAIGPVLVGTSLVAGGGWRPAYAVFGGASLLLVVPMRVRSIGASVPQRLLGSPRGVLLPCLAFFVYVGLEVSLGQWAFTYLTDVRGLGDLAGAVWVALYWVGLTGGRLWLGLAGQGRSPSRILALGVLGTAGGNLVLWLGGPLAPAGLPAAGLGLSVIFPLLMLLTPGRVGEGQAAAAIGWQTAAAAVGGAAGSAAVGVVLVRAGVDAYGPATFVITLALAITLAALRDRPVTPS